MLCPRLTLVSAVSSAIRLFTCEPIPQHSARARRRIRQTTARPCRRRADPLRRGSAASAAGGGSASRADRRAARTEERRLCSRLRSVSPVISATCDGRSTSVFCCNWSTCGAPRSGAPADRLLQQGGGCVRAGGERAPPALPRRQPGFTASDDPEMRIACRCRARWRARAVACRLSAVAHREQQPAAVSNSRPARVEGGQAGRAAATNNRPLTKKHNTDSGGWRLSRLLVALCSIRAELVRHRPAGPRWRVQAGIWKC